jgi:hypothetical protein
MSNITNLSNIEQILLENEDIQTIINYIIYNQNSNQFICQYPNDEINDEINDDLVSLVTQIYNIDIDISDDVDM